MGTMDDSLSFFVSFLILVCTKVTWATTSRNTVFDWDLYKNVLDSEECQRQLAYINNDTQLRLRFLDAGWRIPRSLLRGNTRDLGNYFQCLNINENVDMLDMQVEGKFCTVQFPLNQDFPTLPIIPNTSKLTWDDNVVMSLLNPEFKIQMRNYEIIQNDLKQLVGDFTEVRTSGSAFANTTLELAICIPKVCTARESLDFYSRNQSSFMEFEERFCRLPNDKPWVAADTVAVVLLSTIGLLTVLSTVYDIRHTIFLNRDAKQANQIYKSFSIYTNTRNFFIFPSGSSVITCLDGIRSIAMLWVIVGHTFVTQLSFIPENPLDVFEFAIKFSSIWITSAPITVDTFFVIGGLLVVYITASKMSRGVFLKNIHLFYLNRLLRMFPVLAFGVLMMASFLHRTADGPYFGTVANAVNNCRNNWWSTLLYVQNLVNPTSMCLPHSWYLAIDMQLYVFSPLVLFWVLGPRKRMAWLAMGIAFVGFLIGTSVYNFINDFQSTVISFTPRSNFSYYMSRYYYHPLNRVPQFLIGMMVGYVLHSHRLKKPRIPKTLVLLLWIVTFAGTTSVFISPYWPMQPDWDNQLVDNILNSYKRPVWAACIGWLIFACHSGYGGPINWALSLHAFKILGRLSYAMYILHYPLIFLMNATTLTPIYFSTHFTMYRFLIDFSLALIAAFLVTIFIDFPFSNLVNLVLGGAKKRTQNKDKQHFSQEKPEV